MTFTFTARIDYRELSRLLYRVAVNGIRGQFASSQHGRWKCLKVGGASSGRSHGERVEREPITGVWGQSPQRGPGAPPTRVPGGRSGGRSPPEAESFLVLERPTERQNFKMSNSIRLSLTSQCRRLKLLGEQELWPDLPCQKLGEQLLPLLPCSNAHA